MSHHMADAALRGDPAAVETVASNIIRVERDNLVERPWGGGWIRSFKRIPAEAAGGAMPWGEAFELAAFNDDAESARFPSIVRFEDGSILELPALLEAQGEALLGPAFVTRYGACFPLLPKILDVKELLSVQGHPPGNTEVYIIIDAEPGATLRLGFSQDIEPEQLKQALRRGLDRQSELLDMLGPDADVAEVQATVAPWFARRDAGAAELAAWIEARFAARAADATALLTELKALYWRALELMNAVEARPGQVIYNATPERILASHGGPASAEVHALGNPEGREILALEIRRPGPTFRAWDNVRFPRREVDVEAAIDALNLRATSPDEFICDPQPVAGRAGVRVSVDCEFFRVEHLAPEARRAVTVPASAPHSLHCLAGAVEAISDNGSPIGRLDVGESALVPVGVGGYRLESDAPADVVRVTLPES
jgi:mannose-6-phosphate isomerase class I